MPETEVTLAVVAAVAIAAFLLGAAKGGVSGLGPLITIVVASAVPSTVAIGVLLPLLMIGDVLAIAAHRGRWDRRILLGMLPGAAVGVAVASLFLGSASEDFVRITLAVVVLTFAAYRLVEPFVRRRIEGPGDRSPGEPAAHWAALAGASSGVTSTVAHAGGPPVSVYLLATRVEPRTFVATSAAYFFAVNWMKVPGYVWAGLFDVDLLIAVAPTALLIGPGILVGRWFVGWVDQVWFDRLVLVSLVVGAVLLLV